MHGPPKAPPQPRHPQPTQKRVLIDRVVQPEYTIPTETNFTIDLDDDIRQLKYDARVHVEGVKQWVNKTLPVRQPFDGDVQLPTFDDPVPGISCDSAASVSVAGSDSLEEKWRRREFDRVYAEIAHRYQLRHAGDKTDARRVAEKVARYKEAFLKGFYEARIRRIESNKWLYEKLHVKPEHIKEKYRRLMYASQPVYVVPHPPDDGETTPAATAPNCAGQQPGVAAQQPAAETEADRGERSKPMATADRADVANNDDHRRNRSQPVDGNNEDGGGGGGGGNDDDDEDDDDGALSVYSFAPERDNVLLQDVTLQPHVRGFGRDKRKLYDPKLRLLHLDKWMPPDIEQWMNERRLNEAAAADLDDQSDYYRGARRGHLAGDQPDNARPPKDDLKYEEIRGATELPAWLGPKKLDETERDFENFRRLSVDEAAGGSVLKDENEEQRKPAEPITEEDRAAAAGVGAIDDGASDVSNAVSETPSKCLLRQLIQSQSKDYYKLWYATHDTYNTTPFLEARLQRLMREVFGKKEWAVYREYLKNKGRRKLKNLLPPSVPPPPLM